MKTVLIANSDGLLSAGVAHLLHQDGGLSVIGSTHQLHTSLLVEITDYHPDIVIIDETQYSFLFQILEKFPKLCVIVLSSHNNWIQVFERQELYINEPLELVAVIKRTTDATDRSK